MSIAEFSERKEDSGDRMYPKRVTVCTTCGWESRNTNGSLYGGPNDLALDLLAHRIAHLEGRIKETKR